MVGNSFEPGGLIGHEGNLFESILLGLRLCTAGAQ